MKIFYALVLLLFLIMNEGNAMADERNKVAKNAIEVCPINISQEIPDANLQTIEGKEINIREVIKGKKSINYSS